MGFLEAILNSVHSFFSADEGLDLTEYVGELESHFSVKLTPGEIESTYTLRDMTDLIVRKARENGRADTSDEVWPALRRITSEQFAVDEGELNPDIRYIEDLNC